MMTLASLANKAARRLSNLSPSAQLLVLLAIAAVTIFLGLGLRSPWPADEPRFAEAAREMVASGQWLIPMRGGEFYPDKPPMFMWTIALFYRLTGSLKVAFLLPNALCGLLTFWLVVDLGRRLAGHRVALTAGFFLLLAPQFLIQAKSAQIDGMVACWITLACYGLLRHFFERPNWVWYFGSWAFMGLGIITKGVGFLPMLMMAPILALASGNRLQFQGALQWRCLLGPLVMLAVAAAWVVPMSLCVDALGTEYAFDYRADILFKQTGERYTDSWGHILPWHYFLSNAIPLLWFPLPLVLIAYWRSAWQSLRQYRIVFTLLVWVALVVAFFSMSPGKRGVYVLPALPMFALALAMIVHGKQSAAHWLGPLLTGLQAVVGIALVALGVLAWNDYPSLMAKISDYSSNPSHLHRAGSLIFVVGLCWLGNLAWAGRFGALTRLFLAWMMTWMIYSTWGYVLAEPFRTPEAVLRQTAAVVPAGSQLGLIKFSEQFILFSPLDVVHFGHSASTEEQERNAWRWLRESDKRYLLVAKDLPLSCFHKDGALEVGVAHRDTWMLLSHQQQAATCPAPERVQSFFTARPGSWLD